MRSVGQRTVLLWIRARGENVHIVQGVFRKRTESLVHVRAALAVNGSLHYTSDRRAMYYFHHHIFSSRSSGLDGDSCCGEKVVVVHSTLMRSDFHFCLCYLKGFNYVAYSGHLF